LAPDRGAWHDHGVTVGERILAGLAVVSAVFAGVVGVWGAYLLATAGDDELGVNGVLGRVALGTCALYAMLAVGVLFVVRRRRDRA
jgi:hypothetical protein